MSAFTTVRIEDFPRKRGLIEEDDGWGFSTAEVQVTFSNDAWWRFIEAVQEWLGECPHCGKSVGALPSTEGA